VTVALSLNLASSSSVHEVVAITFNVGVAPVQVSKAGSHWAVVQARQVAELGSAMH